MGASQKVHVPQEDGELVLTSYEGSDDGTPRTFRVQGHLVSPANSTERDQLLRLVDGARKATAADEPKTDPGGKTPA